MKRKSLNMNQNCGHERQEKRMRNSGGGYVGDRRLVSRVQQYLEGQRNKKTVNIISMADDLQAKFSEYGRKKRNAFRICVEKAYNQVATMKQQTESDDGLSSLEMQYLETRKKKGQTSNLNEDTSSSASFSDNEGGEDYTVYEDKNAMNSFMRDLYKRPGSRTGSLCGSRPGSGASTPIGSQSPRHVTDTDTPTPLFTIDRSGNRGLILKVPPPKQQKVPVGSKQEGIITAGAKNQVAGQEKSGASPLKRTILSHGSPTPKDTIMPPTIDLTEEGTVTNSVSHDGLHQEQGSLHDLPVKEDPMKGKPAENTGFNSHDPSTPSHLGCDANKTISTLQKGSEISTKPSTKKRRKLDPEEEKKKKIPLATQSKITFADVGGNDKVLTEVCKLLVHLKHPEVYGQLGVIPPRGLLLHGPPGCGKTLLAHAIAGELELPFIKMAATEVVSGVSGESEEKLREMFQNAMATAPCVLFIDEIDAITPKRENASKDMERRIVSQLLTCMDDLNTKESAHVLVIGATNRPDSIDPALRRAGRFDREISLGIPDQEARERILRVLCRNLRVEPDFNFVRLAQLTPGFVGADLMALAREAAITAVSRIFRNLHSGEFGRDISQVSQSACASTMSEDTTQHNSWCPEVVGVPAPYNNNTQLDRVIESKTLRDELHTAHPTDDKHASVSVLKDVSEVCATSIENTSHHSLQPAADGSVLLSVGDEQMETEPSLKQMETDSSTVQMESATPSEQMGLGTSILQPRKRKDVVEKLGLTSVCNEETLRNHEVNKEKIACDSAFLKALEIPGSEKSKAVEDDLKTLLQWLKDQPPLTEKQLQELWIHLVDFEAALRHVQPSAKREGFVTIPDVTWDDIGALKDVREELQMAILAPVRHPEHFHALGLTSPPGILLAGPPGCGKTLLAKAVANESGINFISVKGPELLNMYVGESERAVRQVFQRARNSAPCVIFFDELDALCPRRSDSGEGGSSVRVVNQLLTEMDGLEERKQVFIMAATNRPDIIDPAVLRPGRLDKTLYVGLPGRADRLDILNTITKNGTKPRLTEDVNLKDIAHDSRSDGYTGADLAALVREAAVTALRDFMSGPQQLSQQVVVSYKHFNMAFNKIVPSVSQKEKKKYQQMQGRLEVS